MCVVEKADEQTWPQNGPATHLPFPPISRWPAGDRRQVTGQTERKRGGGEGGERGPRSCGTARSLSSPTASPQPTSHRKRQVISCLCQVIWRGCPWAPSRAPPPFPRKKPLPAFPSSQPTDTPPLEDRAAACLQRLALVFPAAVRDQAACWAASRPVTHPL